MPCPAQRQNTGNAGRIKASTTNEMTNPTVDAKNTAIF
jgi:hypothetical protein